MKIDPVIQLTGVIKDYGSEEFATTALHGINLTVYKGDFIAITGPSGSGKSTLLNIIGLLDTATSGTYLLNEKDVTKINEDQQAYIRNREIGFVFQSFNLLKRVNVLENVILPSIYTGTNKTEREKRAKELLIKVGLEDHIYKKPNQLSGGQQQRVAIARALMNEPSLILADEPTGNLDTASGNEIMTIVKDLNRQGKTIIMITHENDIAKQAKKLVQIKDGKVL
ncbi:ABC transporter ATP-binding protein [Patescibacteria group bacterium]|nr:ABC transporter ATP-binding protein [Patescibacteria group bacterium]MBU4016448.1 ABC transporter ATP-binding protein [Patescibacteria group bacterium]MBU4098161.1 ABC transporter ATP-binding protein [Patescibacteria group bacterium]